MQCPLISELGMEQEVSGGAVLVVVVVVGVANTVKTVVTIRGVVAWTVTMKVTVAVYT